MPTDAELVAEIKQGSKAAMDVLVKRHYHTVFAFFYRKLGNDQLAYDLTQEVFIKVIKAIPRYKNSKPFSHWLLTIAVNHSRDYFRSRAHQQSATQLPLFESLKDESADIPKLLSKKLDSERVKEALGLLPDHQREAIILKYYHDLSIKEIASLSNKKRSNCKIKATARHP
ncbi:RNA polymerase sigma-70 factor, ECF subfamily [Bacillus sp. JCM 19045]|nr:RNA polymerase sigma-70 factor, ECF subfamily [Bacillus sp. JCM 19045]